MPKAKSRKRPCRICRRWFLPDVRHQDRQNTCGRSECRDEWHRRQCAEWNRKNKEYFKANYLVKKLEKVNDLHVGVLPVKTPTVPAPRIRLHLPRQDIQDVMGPKLLVIIEYIIEQIIQRQRLRL
jgi:hypothetical protein